MPSHPPDRVFPGFNQTVQRCALTGSVLLSLALLPACSLMEKLPLPGKPAPSTSSGNAVLNPSTEKAQADPEAVKRHLDAGNDKAKAGQWQEALLEFEQALALDALNAPAHVQAGWAYAELKQWDKAKAHLIEALKSDPRNAAAHANLAWVYAENKRWHDAEREAKTAIDLDPQNPYPHATLAWAYQESGQPELALMEYEKSLELNPTLENSHFALGVAYCNKGIVSRAQTHLDKLTALKSPRAVALQT